MKLETIRIQLFILAVVLVMIFLLFRLITRNKLREEYAITLTVGAVVVLFFSLYRSSLHALARVFGVDYPPSLLFVFAALAFLVFIVHLAVVASKFHRQIKDLTHEVAFLKQQLTAKEAAADTENA